VATLPLTAWYRCFEAPYAISVDERLSAWVFGGQSVIPKVAYDLAWASTGYPLDAPEYQYALSALDSFVSDDTDNDGNVFAVIVTPVSVLNAVSEDWLTCQTEGCPCWFIRGLSASK